MQHYHRSLAVRGPPQHTTAHERDDQSASQGNAKSLTIPIDRLTAVYMNTTEDLSLRHMLVWSMSRNIVEDALEGSDAEKWPWEALEDVLRLIQENRSALTLSKDRYKMFNMCSDYPIHEEGVRCFWDQVSSFWSSSSEATARD